MLATPGQTICQITNYANVASGGMYPGNTCCHNCLPQQHLTSIQRQKADVIAAASSYYDSFLDVMEFRVNILYLFLSLALSINLHIEWHFPMQENNDFWHKGNISVAALIYYHIIFLFFN